MDPMTIMALGTAASGLLGGAKGGGKTSYNTQTTVSNPINIVNPTTQTFGLALTNNPTIANMIGAGSSVAPASGGTSQPMSLSPNVNAPLDTTTSPSLSASDGSNPASVLPRTSPTGSLGLGSGFATPRPALAQNDLLLLLMIGAGAFLLIQTQ